MVQVYLLLANAHYPPSINFGCATGAWQVVCDCTMIVCGAAAELPYSAGYDSKPHAPPLDLHHVLLADLNRRSSPTKLKVQAPNVEAQALCQAGFRQHALNPVNGSAIPE